MGRYSRSFKEEAMKLVTQQGYKPAEAARKLGIPDSTFGKWMENSGWKKEDSVKLSDDPHVLKVQIRELQTQVKRLQMEKDILKKATAYFASLNQ
jgi:transposase